MRSPSHELKARRLTTADVAALALWVAASCWALRVVVVAAARGATLLASRLLESGLG